MQEIEPERAIASPPWDIPRDRREERVRQIVRRSWRTRWVLRSEALRVGALLSLCLILFFVGMSARPLWNQDEGMHAATAKEMVLTGDWVTPVMNGEPFYDKPAFHNWLIASCYLALGFTEFASRLPNALMGLATVVATYWLGRRLYGPRAGLLAGFALATSFEFWTLSRTVMHDMSLTFFVSVGLALFFVACIEERHRRAYFLLACSALGGAALVKGPLGLVLPVGIALAFLMARRRSGLVRGWPVVSGILVVLAVAAPWYLAISLRNPDYARYFFLELNLGSFFSQASHHPEPINYYVSALIGGFFPWSLFLPVALVSAWRQRAGDRDGSTLFLIMWAGCWFLFFSLAESKLATYILPMFPPLALLVARLWDELLSRPAPGLIRAAVWSFAPVSIIPIALIRQRIKDPSAWYLAEYGLDLRTISSILLVLVLGLAISAICLRAGRSRLAFAGIVLSVAVFLGLFMEFVIPGMTERQTSKTLALTMDELVPQGETLKFVDRLRDSSLFYTNRRAEILDGPAEAAAFLASSEAAYCLMEEDLFEDSGLEGYVVARAGIDVLISNRAGPWPRAGHGPRNGSAPAVEQAAAN